MKGLKHNILICWKPTVRDTLQILFMALRLSLTLVERKCRNRWVFAMNIHMFLYLLWQYSSIKIDMIQCEIPGLKATKLSPNSHTFLWINLIAVLGRSVDQINWIWQATPLAFSQLMTWTIYVWLFRSQFCSCSFIFVKKNDTMYTAESWWR